MKNFSVDSVDVVVVVVVDVGVAVLAAAVLLSLGRYVPEKHQYYAAVCGRVWQPLREGSVVGWPSAAAVASVQRQEIFCPSVALRW